MDALKIYSSTIHKKDTRYLKPIFNKLEQPDVSEPTQNFTTTQTTNMDGDVTYKPTPTTFESAGYNDRIKNWI